VLTDGPVSRYNRLRHEGALHCKAGQYLAFIYYYTKVNGRPPAEADMQRHFRVTPPSVHQMVLTLEFNGFIGRITDRWRSIHLLIPREQLPDLE
jgi:hypothetical protein